MKKKYLALLLSAIMCSSVFFTGCGKTADEPAVEDDDDDEDDDKDDDKDDDEDDEDEEDVYVKYVEDDDLAQQIKVFVKNKKLWTATDEGTVELADAAYCVTDLDHNGRCELLVMTESSYYSVTDLRIYEITESGDAFKEADWKFGSSVDICPDEKPDLIYYPLNTAYYDKKKNISHYLINNTFDHGNGEYGNCFCDMEYSNGVATVNTYAAIQVNETIDQDTYEVDYDYTYLTPDGEVDDNEYFDIIDNYPEKHEPENVYFGIYYRGYYNDHSVMGLDDKFLVSVLTDSYRVFSGESTYDDFYMAYSEAWETPDYTETYYEQFIGTWGLYSIEVEGYETFYDSSSSQFATLEFTPDSIAEIIEYKDGKEYLSWQADVVLNDNMDPYFELTDRDYLQDGVMMESYTVTETDPVRDSITVYLDYYGEDGYLGGSTLTFIRGWN